MYTSAEKLWNKNFILYAFGYELATMGSSLLRFAIPIHILIATGSPALLGTVLALSWFPYVLFALPSGLLADRFSKRNIMIVCNIIIMVSICLYIILIGHLDPLFASVMALVLVTVLESIQVSSSESALYLIVPKDKIMEANSVTFILMMGSGIVVPVVAGVMLSHLGLNAIIYVSVFLYIFVILLYWRMKVPFTKPDYSKGLFPSIGADIKSGFKYIWLEDKVLKRGTVGLFLYALLYFPAENIIPSTLIYNVLGMGETSIGLSHGIIQIGGVLGVVLIKIFSLKINMTKMTCLLVTASIAQLLTIVIFMIIPHDLLAFVLVTFGLMVVNTLLTMFGLNYFTYLGQNTPEEIIGKIMSVAMAIMMLGAVVSQFVVGRLFHFFSYNLERATIIIPVIIIVVSLAIQKKA